ncbi:hypothetical protein OIDMADRAFT_148421 [Oidiodendron maius Zn]|uniref:F-box domain-containing protein n=1 Tax=Oidiodendron maius (strain Zn) TaxID=913774 RepID=A0A0C3D1S9_OIDMZ|nr:hypothetical protein OIDMADRAFT_148421 [Oidiodendron maius Zn]
MAGRTIFVPRLSLSAYVCPDADTNMHRRAEVTTEPGIYEPVLSEVIRHSWNVDQEVCIGGTFFDVSYILGVDTFIMHANCYSLLARFLHPEPISISRLVEACRSCPRDSCPFLLSWGPGHTYGGIIKLTYAYPWGEQDHYNLCDQDWNEGERGDPEDPWNVPEISRHLQGSQLDSLPMQSEEIRWPIERCPARLAISRDTISNYFTKFPFEILELILACTPTDGVKSLALTSKELNTIIPSRLGQSFWASRFQDPFDHGPIFEVYTYKHKLDWKSLYFSIAKDQSPRLQNRRRIWGLLQSLSDIIHLQWKDSQGLLPLDKDENKLRWKEVHGFQQRIDYRRDGSLENGCFQLYSQSTSIPAHLRRIIISIISIGSTTYITGLQFIPNEGTEICLGYTSRKGSSLEMIGLQGFIVAVGSRGIHAIQFVTPTRQLSQWFGDPEGVPQTRRLVLDKPITAIKAGFDGFKMVSLAVADTSSPNSSNKTISVRDNALWFPRIPEDYLQLNKNYVKREMRRLGPSAYNSETENTEGYTVKRTAKEVKDIITFVKNGELQLAGFIRVPGERVYQCDLSKRHTLLNRLEIPSRSRLEGLYVEWDDFHLKSLGAIVNVMPATNRQHMTRKTEDLTI